MRVFGPRFRNGTRGSLKLEALRKMPVGATSSRGDLRDALYWRIHVTIISVAYLIPDGAPPRPAFVVHYRRKKRKKKRKREDNEEEESDVYVGERKPFTGNRENRRSQA